MNEPTPDNDCAIAITFAGIASEVKAMPIHELRRLIAQSPGRPTRAGVQQLTSQERAILDVLSSGNSPFEILVIQPTRNGKKVIGPQALINALRAADPNRERHERQKILVAEISRDPTPAQLSHLRQMLGVEAPVAEQIGHLIAADDLLRAVTSDRPSIGSRQKAFITTSQLTMALAASWDDVPTGELGRASSFLSTYWKTVVVLRPELAPESQAEREDIRTSKSSLVTSSFGLTVLLGVARGLYDASNGEWRREWDKPLNEVEGQSDWRKIIATKIGTPANDRDSTLEQAVTAAWREIGAEITNSDSGADLRLGDIGIDLNIKRINDGLFQCLARRIPSEIGQADFKHHIIGMVAKYLASPQGQRVDLFDSRNSVLLTSGAVLARVDHSKFTQMTAGRSAAARDAAAALGRGIAAV